MMSRLLFTLGGLAVEVATLAIDGLMAGAVCLAGLVVTGVHCLSDSRTFRRVVDRMCGLDLPEVRSDGLEQTPRPIAERGAGHAGEPDPPAH